MHIALIVNHDKHVGNHGRRGFDSARVVATDHDMEWFKVTRFLYPVATTARTLLDAALAANGNFASRLGFEFLLRLAAWSDN